jgi:hypothetical protein
VAGGWAEYEIRRLPGVVACSVTPAGVAILVGPKADADAVAATAAAILAATGFDAPIEVLGGVSRAGARAASRRRSPILAGAAAGVAVLTAAGTVAALTGAIHLDVLPSHEHAASPPAPVTRVSPASTSGTRHRSASTPAHRGATPATPAPSAPATTVPAPAAFVPLPEAPTSNAPLAPAARARPASTHVGEATSVAVLPMAAVLTPAVAPSSATAPATVAPVTKASAQQVVASEAPALVEASEQVIVAESESSTLILLVPDAREGEVSIRVSSSVRAHFDVKIPEGHVEGEFEGSSFTLEAPFSETGSPAHGEFTAHREGHDGVEKVKVHWHYDPRRQPVPGATTLTFTADPSQLAPVTRTKPEAPPPAAAPPGAQVVRLA